MDLPDPKIRAAFERIKGLKDLTVDSQNLLLPFASLRTIRQGETLFCQGEPSPYCYGVLAGKVTVVYSLPGAEPSSQVCAAGSFIAGIALLQEMPRPGMAQVSQDGELLALWASRFREAPLDLRQRKELIVDLKKVLQASP